MTVLDDFATNPCDETFFALLDSVPDGPDGIGRYRASLYLAGHSARVASRIVTDLCVRRMSRNATYAEVAARLEVSEAQVQARVIRANRHLGQPQRSGRQDGATDAHLGQTST